MPEVRAPDPIVADVHDAVAVQVRWVATVRLPEVLPPHAVVPNVDDAVTVDVPEDADRGGGRRDGWGGRRRGCRRRRRRRRGPDGGQDHVVAGAPDVADLQDLPAG